MATLFGRNNADIMDGIPVSPERFHPVADDNGDIAVYDSHTGRYAPFYGDTGVMTAADLNDGKDQASRYQWKDTL